MNVVIGYGLKDSVQGYGSFVSVITSGLALELTQFLVKRGTVEVKRLERKIDN
jgi:hypothetical protein